MSDLSRRQARGLCAACFAVLVILMAPALHAGATVALRDTQGPIYGGTIHVAYVSSAANLDSSQAYTADWGFINGTLYNGLYQLDRNARPQLDLAAGPPTLSADHKVWTFQLRKGVLFHNGRELTADDVKFSLTRVLDPHLKPAVSWGQSTDDIFVGSHDFVLGKTKGVPEIQVLGRYTIRFVLARPVAVLPFILAESFNSIVPKAVVTRESFDYFDSHPVGTGPYMLQSWNKAAKRIIVVRNPHYYHKGKPYIDKVIADFDVPQSLLALQIEKGVVDGAGFAASLAAADLQQARSDPRYARYIVEAPPVDAFWLDVNVHVAPLDKLAVRQAIAMAINRHHLLRLMGGQVIPTTQFYIPLAPQYDRSLEQRAVYPYDPQKAAALVRSSGYHGQLISLLYGSAGGSPPGAVLGIQQDLRQIGLNVSIRGVTFGTLFALVKSLSGHQLSLNDWIADFPDAYDVYAGVLSCVANGDGAQAAAHYCSAASDDLVTRAQALPLGADRNALLRQAQILNLRSASRVPLYYAKALNMIAPRVRGFYPHPIFGWQYENYWLQR